MDSLLRWGIENSVPGTSSAPVERKDLDPGIIDHILGKSDAVLMKEALDVAVDIEKDEDDRVQALDNFEMLVENIDNANDMERLKMWLPLHSLLTSPASTTSIKVQVLWVIGTALQNNPAAQSAYMALDPMHTIVSFLSQAVETSQLRSKAVYTLSGLCKHNLRAVQQLEEANGWEILKSALEDSDITVRRKTVFLLNSLLLPTQVELDAAAHPGLHTPASPSAPIHANSHASMLRDPSSTATSRITSAALEEHKIFPAFVNALTNPVPHGQDGEKYGDIDFEEKIIQLLSTYVLLKPAGFAEDALSRKDTQRLKQYLDEKVRSAGDEKQLADLWGMAHSQLSALRKVVD